ncbi:MAG: hypothetical protein M3347_18855 [Armatimonadota bacterium]|nr:hypothetical protein [Armatimonadota bacterium]
MIGGALLALVIPNPPPFGVYYPLYRKAQTIMKMATRLVLLVNFALVAVPASAQQKGKFPYAGQWAKNIPTTTGENLVMKYTFDKKGQCVLSVIYPSGSKKNWLCSYVMRGKAALVSYTRFGTTKGERRRYVQRFRLTPLSNGTKLLYKEIDLSYQVIGKSSQWHTRKLRGEFQMTRVRNN